MANLRQCRANRANARASSGPKSAQGKARASKNALRHGLTLPVMADPTLSQEVKRLAQQIAAGDPHLLPLAYEVAQAQADLLRIKRVREDLSARRGQLLATRGGPNERPLEGELLKLARYERRARSRRKLAIRKLDAARRQG